MKTSGSHPVLLLTIHLILGFSNSSISESKRPILMQTPFVILNEMTHVKVACKIKMLSKLRCYPLKMKSKTPNYLTSPYNIMFFSWLHTLLILFSLNPYEWSV